jgi:hypothetical protein
MIIDGPGVGILQPTQPTTNLIRAVPIGPQPGWRSY